MRAAVLEGPGRLESRDVPTPSAGPGEVLVEVGANTVCGTDLRIMRGEKTSGVRTPVILGHETAGHVAEVGAGVVGYEVGAPVAMAPVISCRSCPECRNDLENACRNVRIMGYAIDGGMAEHMLVPADGIAAGNLFTAKRELPSEQLALAEPLACVVNGHRWAGAVPDETVVVMGAGPIGLFHLQVSLLSGARAVIVSEPSAARRAHAERLGATRTVDPGTDDLAAAVDDVSDQRGADVTVVAIGVPELVHEAVALTRVGGRVNLFAGFPKQAMAEVDPNLIHYRQVVVTGSSNARRRDYETALRFIEAGQVDTASMVTHRFGLDDVADAINTVAAGDALKVAVLP